MTAVSNIFRIDIKAETAQQRPFQQVRHCNRMESRGRSGPIEMTTESYCRVDREKGCGDRRQVSGTGNDGDGH